MSSRTTERKLAPAELAAEARNLFLATQRLIPPPPDLRYIARHAGQGVLTEYGEAYRRNSRGAVITLTYTREPGETDPSGLQLYADWSPREHIGLDVRIKRPLILVAREIGPYYSEERDTADAALQSWKNLGTHPRIPLSRRLDQFASEALIF